MRAVVQRVSQASVTGGGRTAEIGRGLCVLIGFETTDTSRECDALLSQLLKLKVFSSATTTAEGETERPWSAGVRDIDGEMLLVSQFTLNAQLKSGKPSFHRAMPPEPAKEMFDCFVDAAKREHPNRVRNCVFGSMMNVHLVNEGPFTICLTAADGKCSVW